MRRAHPSPDTVLLAGLAALAAAVSATTLVEGDAWIVHAVWFTALVLGIGVGLRRLAWRGLLVVPGQLLAATLAATWSYAASTTWFGVPTAETARHFGRLFSQFGQTVYRASAPLPDNAGVQVSFTLATVLLVVLVDHIAITRAAPAAAGLPLLAVYLTAAANNSETLHPGFFLVAVIAWLALLARHARRGMQRWAAASGPALQISGAVVAGGDRDAIRYGIVARRLAVGGMLAALAVANVLPHLPTRFLLDGLARDDRGAGPARVGFASTLDVGRSVIGGDRRVVLRYRTTAPTPAPLRVLATTAYDGTTWAQPRPLLGGASPLAVDASVPRVDRVIAVQDYTLDPPALATPQPIIAADFRGVPWRIDQSTHDVYVQSRPASYSTTYVEVELTAALLRDGVDGRPGADRLPIPASDESLRVDPASAAAVRAALTQARAGEFTSPYDTAAAIQSWLRERGGFDYSLALAAPTGAGTADPVTEFLASKRGYCVQFASAMVLMARAAGIPARMAIGFLPGSLQDGLYVVVAADAHAWPELFFPGAGWVRFEPTPAGRSGTAPPWTTVQPTSAPTASVATPTTAAPAEALPPSERENVTRLDGQAPEASVVDTVREWLTNPVHLVLLGLALGLLGGVVLPVTALLVRRSGQRTANAEADRVEASWQSLTSRLGDLGVPAPPGGTLRDARDHYVAQARLEGRAREGLLTLVATVERARYARPGADLPEGTGRHAALIVAAVARRRTWRVRLRALLLPREGRRFWQHLRDRAARRVRRSGARQEPD